MSVYCRRPFPAPRAWRGNLLWGARRAPGRAMVRAASATLLPAATARHTTRIADRSRACNGVKARCARASEAATRLPDGGTMPTHMFSARNVAGVRAISSPSPASNSAGRWPASCLPSQSTASIAASPFDLPSRTRRFVSFAAVFRVTCGFVAMLSAPLSGRRCCLSLERSGRSRRLPTPISS